MFPYLWAQICVSSAVVFFICFLCFSFFVIINRSISLSGSSFLSAMEPNIMASFRSFFVSFFMKIVFRSERGGLSAMLFRGFWAICSYA